MAWSITSLYTGSFDGQGFFEEFASGESPPFPDLDQSFEAIHYPGTDDNELQEAGALHQIFDLPVAVDGTGHDALVAAWRSDGTLIYSGDPSGSSHRLMAITNRRKVGGLDVYRMTLRFWVN